MTTTTTIKSKYDYNLVFQYLEKKGKERFGNNFKIHIDDHRIINMLAAYFLQDEVKCEQYEIDLHKGIMLTGPIGCGKTTLMHLMKFISIEQKRFRIKTSRDISFEFIKDGFDVIHKYSRGDLYKSDSHAYCFDDLGAENNI